MSALAVDGSSGSVRVVVQRVAGASLLVDNADDWRAMGAGVIVYVSFTTRAAAGLMPRVAKKIANLPVVTKGNWGDGTRPVSPRELVQVRAGCPTVNFLRAVLCFILTQLARLSRSLSLSLSLLRSLSLSLCLSLSLFFEPCARAQAGEMCGVMVIPQAGLCAKIKGKSLQYRGQAPKDVGQELYGVFCTALLEAVVVPGDSNGKSKNNGKSKSKGGAADVSPDVSPEDMFRLGLPYAGMFAAFDETGLPTHVQRMAGGRGEVGAGGGAATAAAVSGGNSAAAADGDGAPVAISKSKRKKLLKARAAHQKRHEAYLSDPESFREAIAARAAAAGDRIDAESGGEVPVPPHLTFITGTFGNRQGLKLDASCGPFTHAFTFA